MFLVINIKRTRKACQSRWYDYKGTHEEHERLLDENGIQWKLSAFFPTYHILSYTIPAEFVFVDGAYSLILTGPGNIRDYLGGI